MQIKISTFFQKFFAVSDKIFFPVQKTEFPGRLFHLFPEHFDKISI